jgi:hypothetical protein
LAHHWIELCSGFGSDTWLCLLEGMIPTIERSHN